MFLRPGIEDRFSDQIDVWPQIIGKSQAKGMINYERICKQTVANFMRDLTKFPVKSLSIKNSDWEMIRLSFQRNYLFIATSNNKFLRTFCKGLHGN